MQDRTLPSVELPGQIDSIELPGQIDSSADGGIDRLDMLYSRVNELAGRMDSFENALHEFGGFLAQMREQMREINDHYRDILDKHDQLVIYIQSSVQYCENKESIDALFDVSEENSLTATELSKKLAALEERLVLAENSAKGKMPLSQGEQLLKVLKIHHGKISELYDRLRED